MISIRSPLYFKRALNTSKYPRRAYSEHIARSKPLFFAFTNKTYKKYQNTNQFTQ